MTLPNIKNVAHLSAVKPSAGGIQYAYQSDNILMETGADLLAEGFCLQYTTGVDL